MHKELKGTDIQWLAEGWWSHYFKYRACSKANTTGVLAIVAVLVGLALLLTGFIASGHLLDAANDVPLPTWVVALFAIGGVALLAAFVLFMRVSDIERRERDKFVDYVTDRWEEGCRDIPDAETVADYLKSRSLLN